MPIIEKGDELTSPVLRYLANYGFRRLLIHSDQHHGVEYSDVVPQEVKNQGLKILADTFQGIRERKGWSTLQQYAQKIEDLADEILEHLNSQHYLVADLMNVKCTNRYMLEHSLNVGVLGAIVGKNYHFSQSQVREILMAGLFHDAGKLFIGDNILNKPDYLDSAETEEMRKHPEYGYQILINQYRTAQPIALGSLGHHERWNGSGYPQKLQEHNIPLYGRIIAAIDVFDAMTSDRVYRQGLPQAGVLAYLKRLAGVYFDPEVIAVIERSIYPYPSGSIMKLSTHENAVVAENNPEDTYSPIVQIIQTQLQSGKVLNLQHAQQQISMKTTFQYNLKETDAS
ncbi:MAG TPA: HD-GYP domain-containing protein [bacterium]|nr:HD-GYP domain-containing protein [bacterium]